MRLIPISRMLAIAAAMALAGCTIIKVEGEARTTSLAFGILRLSPPENGRSLVYHSSGIGLVPGRNGMTLGASRETAALIFNPDDCRIILFRPRKADLDQLLALVSASSLPAKDICTLGEDK